MGGVGERVGGKVGSVYLRLKSATGERGALERQRKEEGTVPVGAVQGRRGGGWGVPRG